jgi:group I intron endonuclease
MNQSGIYSIENKINKNKYIGKSIEPNNRWYKHISKLRNNNHENQYLQNAWNKYGEENFKFCIIEECEKLYLSEREIYYIKKLNTKRPNGYNLTDGGDGLLGRKVSKKTREKMSKKRKIRLSNPKNHPMYGKKHSEKAKKKMSLSHKNISIATRKKMSNSAKGNSSHLGYPRSEETKNGLRQKAIGSKHKNATSIFSGVAWDSFNKRWIVSIWNKKKEHIGRFEDEKIASFAYDDRCFEIYGDLSKLNFPERMAE